MGPEGESEAMSQAASEAASIVRYERARGNCETI